MLKITHQKLQKTEQKINAFDILIVFGEGPVKPVLISPELSLEQAKEWEDFKQNPLHTKEPHFWVIEDESYLQILRTIDSNPNFSENDKDFLKKTQRIEWQHKAMFSLKRWGRQNALAAGLSLLEGRTKKIILSGGQTMSPWTRENMPEYYLQNWPSEAELMKDVIVRQFARKYYEMYGKTIDNAIVLENQALNTLENFAYSLNKDPSIVNDNTRVGLLSANYHLERVKALADLFSINSTHCQSQSAQQLLKEKAVANHENIVFQPDANKNPYLKSLLKIEERWTKGITQPQYLSYWLGYIGLVKNPIVVQNTINRLKSPPWIESAQRVFEQLGLQFEEYASQDIKTLVSQEPDKYELLLNKLSLLTSPTYRTMPPAY